MGEGWPFVGRSGELRQLGRCLSGAAAGGVVLSGEAGVGKTRLAIECLHTAEQKGMATVRITATRAGSGIPFGALATLFPADRQDPARPAVALAYQLRRAAETLVGQAEGRRLVLLVDDAHLLDAASATLVHQLAETGAAFVLVTVRAGEPAPDPVVALWKDGLTERIELRGLDAETIEQLLASALSGSVDPGTVAHLAIRCQGNVLLLRELVLGALSEGALSQEEGIWRLVAPYSPSSRLVELVEVRLRDLPPAQRALLELVSLGEPLGRFEVEALGDLEMAEAPEREGLLASRMDDRRLELRLAHPVYGDVLRARMPALRRASRVRSLAEAVEACGARRREDTLRVATWRLEGGGGSPELLLSAAQTARWRYDLPLAERLARAALTRGAGFEAALLAAQTSSLQGRGLEAEAELAELAGRAADDAQRGLVALARVDNYAFYLGSSTEALRVAEEAEATITDVAWSGEIAARRVAMVLGTHGPRAAAELFDALVRRADGRPLVWAASLTAAYSLGRLGRVREALDVAERALAANDTRTSPLDWYPWIHVWSRCEVLGCAGRFEEAERQATEYYQQGIAERSLEEQAWFAWVLTELFAARGHVNSAVARGREAVALFRSLGRSVFLRESLLHLAGAFALAGRAQDASQALAAIDALELPTTNLYSAVDLCQARAWTAAAHGDLPRARKFFEEAADVGSVRGDLVGEATALHGLARIGHAKSVADRLAALSADLEGPLAPARVSHTLALARHDAGALEEVSGVFAALGADLLAAESAADAAVAWLKKNDLRRAAAVERQARALAGRCEGAMSPALSVLGKRTPLTQAEREAALLAAGGRSNKEIATELSLSVRTVEGQLQRVYEKLGISTRADLAEALEASR